MLENSAPPKSHILANVILPFLNHCINIGIRMSSIYDEASTHLCQKVPDVPPHAPAGLLCVTPMIYTNLYHYIYTNDWKSFSEADSDLGSPGWGLRVHIPSKLPGKSILGYREDIYLPKQKLYCSSFNKLLLLQQMQGLVSIRKSRPAN